MIGDLGGTARKTVLRARAALRVAELIRESREALAAIEKQSGPINAGLRTRAKADAIERLGGRQHMPWLMLCAAVAGSYRDGWLPPTYYLQHVSPRVNGTLHHMSSYAAANPLFFASSAFPDILYIVNGRFMLPDLSVLSAEAAVEFLKDTAEEVVFKSDNSGFGLGVSVIRTAAIHDLALLPNGVLQRRIFAHPTLEVFCPSALATLRIGTVLPDMGPPEVRTAYLKLGRASHEHVLARDQIRIAVDRRSGELDDHGFTSRWLRVDRHPDTGQAFAGVHVPGMQDAMETVLSLHARMPLPRFLSWDIAIDVDARPHLLEWEGGVVSFAEPAQGPCFCNLGWDRFHLCARAYAI